MWYALTAHSVKRSRKENKKEFQIREEQIFLSAGSREELEKKLEETRQKFPGQIEKYLEAGMKVVEATTPRDAKKKAHNIPISIEKSGQLKLF
jgi:PIN domain nuclease of toxin-antitoxin system